MTATIATLVYSFLYNFYLGFLFWDIYSYCIKIERNIFFYLHVYILHLRLQDQYILLKSKLLI